MVSPNARRREHLSDFCASGSPKACRSLPTPAFHDEFLYRRTFGNAGISNAAIVNDRLMLIGRMPALPPNLCGGVLIAIWSLVGNEAQAKNANFAPIAIEGKVLSQRPKGKSCKIEIDVSRASVKSDTLRAVRARIVLRQPCVAGLKPGTRAQGTLNSSRLRASTRTTKDGRTILEFSATVHGRLVINANTPQKAAFEAGSSATASGRLIGDADISAAP